MKDWGQNLKQILTTIIYDSLGLYYNVAVLQIQGKTALK